MNRKERNSREARNPSGYNRWRGRREKSRWEELGYVCQGTNHEKAQTDKICTYYDDRAAGAVMDCYLNASEWPKFKEGEVPSKKVECPVCHRRVKMRVTFCHDGCCVLYRMPKHRKRDWQKKDGKKSRDNRLTKRQASSRV